MLCSLAAVAAGSTDGEDMAAKVREDQRSARQEVQLPADGGRDQGGPERRRHRLERRLGQIDMDDKGDPTAGVYDLYRYRDGAVDITGELRSSLRE